jgi:hypothetical protein
MFCQVVCGEYKIVLHSSTARQAALDAIFVWSCKSLKPQLSRLIGVIDGDKTVYFLTRNIIQELDDAS